jgi:hypothetical protein
MPSISDSFYTIERQQDRRITNLTIGSDTTKRLNGCSRNIKQSVIQMAFTFELVRTPTVRFALVLVIAGLLVTPSQAESIQSLRKAAERGDAPAQAQLGYMYYNGRGVPQDYAKAAKWFRRAAEQGYAPAQYNLGVTYRKGEGVPQNYIEAHKWVNLAASKSKGKRRANAIQNRRTLAKMMSRSQIAEAQRLARDWKPSESLSAKRARLPPLRSGCVAPEPMDLHVLSVERTWSRRVYAGVTARRKAAHCEAVRALKEYCPSCVADGKVVEWDLPTAQGFRRCTTADGGGYTGYLCRATQSATKKQQIATKSASPALKELAASLKCRVRTASYGGRKATIIRSNANSTTNYTVLDVNQGREDAESKAYIAAYAKGGRRIGDFPSKSVAMAKAFKLCPK